MKTNISITPVLQNVPPNPRPPDSHGVGQTPACSSTPGTTRGCSAMGAPHHPHRSTPRASPSPLSPQRQHCLSAVLWQLQGTDSTVQKTLPYWDHTSLCRSWNFQILKMLLLHIWPFRTGMKNAFSFSMPIVSEDLARNVFERITEQSKSIGFNFGLSVSAINKLRSESTVNWEVRSCKLQRPQNHLHPCRAGGRHASSHALARRSPNAADVSCKQLTGMVCVPLVSHNS